MQNLPQSSQLSSLFFWESCFASVLDYFVLNDPLFGQSSLLWVFNFAPVWRCVVLKFAPVLSISRTKFCPSLGLFLISLRKKNVLCSPGASPVLGYFVLKFALDQNMLLSSLFLELNFSLDLGYFYVFEMWKMPHIAPVLPRSWVICTGNYTVCRAITD